MISRKVYYLLNSYRNVGISESEIREFRKERIEHILEYAYEYSSFYRMKMNDGAIKPEEFDDYSDLKALDITERDELRNNLNSVKTMIEEFTKYSSTGSNGDKFNITYDEQAADWREAVTVRTELRKGYRPFRKIAELTGNPQTRIGSIFRPKVAIPRDLSIEQQKQILIDENPSCLIYGAHILFRICKTLSEEEKKSLNIKKVFNNGELMTEKMEEYISSELGAEMHDVYETAEVGQIAWNCPEGGYHINEDLVDLEIVDESGQEVDPGEMGDAVVTGLVNRSVPIIRYRIGDVVVKGKNNCSCKTEFGKIRSIEGRTENLIENDEGEIVTPREIIDKLANFTELKKFLFETDGESYTLKFVRGEDFKPSLLDKLSEEVAELGFDEVVFDEMNDVQRRGWKAGPVRNYRVE